MLIVITGPTATGKTALGIELAKKLGGEIVSADSMQVYRYMNIGTAKPTKEQRQNIPHHMIDIVPPWEEYSVARYVREAANRIDNIIKRGKKPIVVGGTGLYIDSLLAGREFAKKGDENLRKELEQRYDRFGGESLLKELEKIDPITAQRLYPNDKKRIVRAHETYITTGKPQSVHDEETRRIPPRYQAEKFALTYENRATLYENIDKRVDNMVKSGLEKEVASLTEMCKNKKSTAMQAIGYKEIAEALMGNMALTEAVEKVKMESRRYAKRQLTWLRRDKTLTWITWQEKPDISGAMLQMGGTQP